MDQLGTYGCKYLMKPNLQQNFSLRELTEIFDFPAKTFDFDNNLFLKFLSNTSLLTLWAQSWCFLS